MDAAEKKQLEITACKIRMGIIEGVHSAKSGRFALNSRNTYLSVFQGYEYRPRKPEEG